MPSMIRSLSINLVSIDSEARISCTVTRYDNNGHQEMGKVKVDQWNLS